MDTEKQALEDRIADLEEALHQAIWSTEFLHCCLTDPNYSYAYPEQTLAQLSKWRELAHPPALCVHSRTMPDCPSCQDHARRMQARMERQARSEQLSDQRSITASYQ